MYTIKFENNQYCIIRPDGKNELDILGRPVVFSSQMYAQIALDGRNSKKQKKEKSAVKGVMDNRHRNWRRRHG